MTPTEVYILVDLFELFSYKRISKWIMFFIDFQRGMCHEWCVCWFPCSLMFNCFVDPCKHPLSAWLPSGHYRLMWSPLWHLISYVIASVAFRLCDSAMWFDSLCGICFAWFSLRSVDSPYGISPFYWHRCGILYYPWHIDYLVIYCLRGISISLWHIVISLRI